MGRIVWLIVFVGLVCAWSLASAQQVKPAPVESIERYVPDRQPQPAPDAQPRPGQVIYAQAIVLTGTNARIVLNAGGQQPSIVLESTRTRERIILYLTSKGQAVVGVQTPGRDGLMASLYVADGHGKLQLAEPRGEHIFDGAELERWGQGVGKVGAAPKE